MVEAYRLEHELEKSTSILKGLLHYFDHGSFERKQIAFQISQNEMIIKDYNYP